MSKLREQVIEFHRANELPGTGLGPPGVPDIKRVQLRAWLIAEEFWELMEALGLTAADDVDDGWKLIWDAISDPERFDVDIVQVADALADLDYVIEGTRLEFGIDGGPIADEVHRSNMSKLGADGKPMQREDGKILKGPNYEPPDVAGCLRAQGWTP